MSILEPIDNDGDGEIDEDFEYYDEPIDNSVWGWEDCDTPCFECGGNTVEKITKSMECVEREIVCMDCEYYSIDVDC